MTESRVCPECESLRWKAKGGDVRGVREDDRDYYCEACASHFDVPTVIEADRHGHDTRKGLPKRLTELDPEEVFSDGRADD